MRKVFAVTVLSVIVLLTGCAVNIPGLELSTESTREHEELTQAESSDAAVYETTTAESVDVTAEPEGTTDEETTESAFSEQTTVGAEETTKKPRPSETTEPSSTSPLSEIDLSIAMPEKNGTMKTDSDKDNKYIEIICNERNISASLLVAVFSVPESGQNYVFEFYDSDGRNSDDIRRVYLIDSKGKITGVAAVSASEKENVSTVENWFCMNVLIKEVIYPAVEDDIK